MFKLYCRVFYKDNLRHFTGILGWNYNKLNYFVIEIMKLCSIKPYEINLKLGKWEGF